MDEIEHLCSRLALFTCGRVEVAESPAALVEVAGCPHRFRVPRAALTEEAMTELGAIPTVSQLEFQAGDVVFSAQLDAVEVPLNSLIRRYSLNPLDVRHESPSLDDAFLKLTGGQERRVSGT